MNLKLSKKDIKANRGITLIALVITIIVLLILAGVTVATLTGDNGILTKAGDAKNTTQQATALERVKTEVIGSYGLDGKIDTTELNKNLKNISNLTYNGEALSNDNKIENLPATVQVDGYTIKIEASGNIKQLSEVAKAISEGTVFNEKNTPITDEDGNVVIVPKGFKLASDSAEVVTGGIVIEDAIYEDTKRSQFVWIPVNFPKASNTTEKIILSRYDYLKRELVHSANEVCVNYFIELTSSSYGNAVAKNLNDFISFTNASGGFWIGRYEARVNYTAKRKSSDAYTTVTEISENSVYNYITQPLASEKSKAMYNENDYFESDLINSYAWDTAMLFLQEYDNRESKTNVYSEQNSLNKTFSYYGTKKDKICNVYDMASNCREWSTEYSKFNSNGDVRPLVIRGGSFENIYQYTKSRHYSKSERETGISFRPILYVK